MTRFRGRKAKMGSALLAVVAVAGVAAAGIAQADNAGTRAGGKEEQSEVQEGAREAAMLAQARVSLGDAARVAEQQTGLRASEGALDDESATPAWEISVGTDAAEKTVIVDASTGKVRSVVADDGEQGEEKEGGETSD